MLLVTQWLSYQSGLTLNTKNHHIMAKNSRGNFEDPLNST